MHKNKAKASTYAVPLAMAAGTAVAVGAWLATRSIRRAQDMKRPIVLPKGFTVTAHAGALNTVDNTAGSVQRCLDFYAATGIPPVLELDVRFTPDGTPYLAHDRVHDTDDVFTLSEAMEMARGYKAYLNLDMKEKTNLQEIQRLAEEYDMVGQVFFTGIDRRHASLARRMAPKIPFYLNASPQPLLVNNSFYVQRFANEVAATGALGLNTGFREASPRLVEALHQHGMRISLWTANSQRDIQLALSLGPDNITSRHPDLLLRVLIERMMAQVQQATGE